MRAAALALALGGIACGEQGGKPAPPALARIEQSVAEDGSTTLKILPEAEERIGIRTVPVARVERAATRTLGGTLEVPAGHASTLLAPQPGTVLPRPDQSMPTPGSPVGKGDLLLRLLSLSARDPTRARDELVLAGQERDVARARELRLAALVEEGAESLRNLEDARAARARAEADFLAARAQIERLERGTPTDGPGAPTAMALVSPRDGWVRALHVGPGQTVSASQPLIEIVATARLWVRVPVFAGDRAAIAADRPVRILALSPQIKREWQGEPVLAPPAADPASASIDLVYAVANPDGALVPGERVRVELPLAPEPDAVAVLRSSVLYDVLGDSWVYERTAPGTYARRRVSLIRTAGDAAVLESGPGVGAQVVAEGAAELFGAELGTGQ